MLQPLSTFKGLEHPPGELFWGVQDEAGLEEQAEEITLFFH